MNVKYKHIIWDWNGTMLNDAWLCVEITNKLLSKRNLPLITSDRYQECMDFPIRLYYNRIGIDFTVESFEDAADEFIVEYDRRVTECSLQDGVRQTIEHLTNRGIRQSILSACEHARLQTRIDCFGLRSYFDKLAGLDDCYAVSKVEVGRNMLRELDCRLEETVLIGDTTHDFETASKIGIDCMLIPSGHQTREKLASCSCTVLCEPIDVLERVFYADSILNHH